MMAVVIYSMIMAIILALVLLPNDDYNGGYINSSSGFSSLFSGYQPFTISTWVKGNAEDNNNENIYIKL